ncbi:fibulin-7 [Notechis scutatus]|uniref:Fibulin-7 n=1 Tax=Notechis scutatus TaxID=8663 RepID=A0A6J1UZ14_9SAUR|nr:fibulin-7 [Notechis scutatus]
MILARRCSLSSLVLVLCLAAGQELQASQNCMTKHQVLATIRQMQQFLKGQETRFVEGLRIMKHRLTNLQNTVTKAIPDLQTVFCPKLEAPANGKKFGTKNLVDHEVHFTCDPGFQLVGSNSRMCQPNGSWTGEVAHCKDISLCTNHQCRNGGTCTETGDQVQCICSQGWTGPNCQYQTQTVPPAWSITNDPAFSRKPRCAQLDRMQHCSCEAGFHMSGTTENSICQDVNECEIYKLEGVPRLCMHACINTPGSYHCSCPPGYKLFNDGKNCEDIDECALSLHSCIRGTTCINIGGSFQCVKPECPQTAGNVSYVKTSPFQCERNPCPMNSRSCHQAPKTISFHYLPLPSDLATPTPLFRMATASAPGRPGPDSLRFGIIGGNSRGHFVMQRSDRQTGELMLVQRLQGPQTITVEVEMSEYLDRTFQAKHVSKITIFVSVYEF